MTTMCGSPLKAGFEPLPGYVLEKLIGTGGFGEVWQATAPGGMHKAIKFVSGSSGDSRAANERRSLERISSIRHPFLLTLERFEWIGDFLVVVTELADGSLEDDFNRHRRAGSCGVARKTLLRHLEEGAEALDYLHQQYSLQHLDIKPGNLLMVAGHVKVADFGLLKDLGAADRSVVGGLTPTYAPPELFDGRPSNHSDQYSLAVMYQEMLTGIRPFAGRTIAQLAAQHVHTAPNLDSLPPRDRVVVAKALEKDPEKRFSSCGEFISALEDAGQNRLDLTPTPDETSSTAPVSVGDLPEVERPGGPALDETFALVVGLGGFGGDAMVQIAAQLNQHDFVKPPHVRGLLIDTDRCDIADTKERLYELSSSIECSWIHTPLRAPSDYRQIRTDRLRSISRRWIYNVPRSGATAGMRPLGRLALVDHGNTVVEKLRASIEQLAKESGAVRPKVYVVASLCGGTGGGMFIDVIHLLRRFLDDAGLADAEVLPMVAAGDLSPGGISPVTAMGVRACLAEIAHYLQPKNGYGGDAGAGFPEVPAARTPLSNLYVVAGNDRGHAGQAPIQTISEYVCLDMAEGRDVLGSARNQNISLTSEAMAPSMHSVGTISLQGNRQHEERQFYHLVTDHVLTDWLGDPTKTQDQVQTQVMNLVKRLDNQNADLESDQPSSDADNQRANRWQQEILKAMGKGTLTLSGAAAVVDQLTRLSESKDLGDNFQTESLNAFADHLDRLCREVALACRENRSLLGLKPSTVVERLASFSKADLSTAVRSIGQNFIANHMSRWFQSIQKDTSSAGEDGAGAFGGDAGRILGRLLKQAAVTVEQLSLGGYQATNVSRQFDARTFRLPSVEPTATNPTASNRLLTSILSPTNTNDTHSFEHGMPGGSTDAVLAETEGAHLQRHTAPSSLEDALAWVRPQLLSLGGHQRLILIAGSKAEADQLESSIRGLHEGSLTVEIQAGATPTLIHEGKNISIQNYIARLAVLGGDEALASRLASRCDVQW